MSPSFTDCALARFFLRFVVGGTLLGPDLDLGALGGWGGGDTCTLGEHSHWAYAVSEAGGPRSVRHPRKASISEPGPLGRAESEGELVWGRTRGMHGDRCAHDPDPLRW